MKITHTNGNQISTNLVLPEKYNKKIKAIAKKEMTTVFVVARELMIKYLDTIKI
jgi:hypothetical protein